ncbi:MAG: diadenylate cyclase CdaA [Alphaproteobacteria bacterium]|nr:diadenylate cyclase CdaA [Alphaproteobacteria bacterium]
MESLREYLQSLLGVSGLTWASFLLQTGIIVFLLWLAYVKLVKNSPAEKTVKGVLFFLVIVWMTGEIFSLFHLRILSGLLKNLILLLLLSFVVIFQPELRRLMARFGNNLSWDTWSHKKRKKEGKDLVNLLMQSISYWRTHKTGALIVFENQEPMDTVLAGGVSLDAVLSAELLINIFFVNTPLHDGAVLIRGKRIVSAGVILPLSTTPDLSWRYGTRHRAAIGLSENTDALCLVISEETGDVSLVKNGKVNTFSNMDELDKKLNNFFTPLIYQEHQKTLKEKWQDLKKKLTSWQRPNTIK